MNNHLIVMARAPVMGAVKTRLAADVGWVAATEFAKRRIREALRDLADPRWTTRLAITPDCEARNFRRYGVPVIGQGPGDLGQRMARLAMNAPPGPVVIVGTDIPDLSRRHIWAAFRALGAAPLVFGPAVDGGYYLVGLKRRPRLVDPFRNVRWSTSHALADALRNVGGLRVAMLETLSDIDAGADWRHLKSK